MQIHQVTPMCDCERFVRWALCRVPIKAEQKHRERQGASTFDSLPSILESKKDKPFLFGVYHYFVWEANTNCNSRTYGSTNECSKAFERQKPLSSTRRYESLRTVSTLGEYSSCSKACITAAGDSPGVSQIRVIYEPVAAATHSFVRQTVERTCFVVFRAKRTVITIATTKRMTTTSARHFSRSEKRVRDLVLLLQVLLWSLVGLKATELPWTECFSVGDSSPTKNGSLDVEFSIFLAARSDGNFFARK